MRKATTMSAQDRRTRTSITRVFVSTVMARSLRTMRLAVVMEMTKGTANTTARRCQKTRGSGWDAPRAAGALPSAAGSAGGEGMLATNAA